MDTVTPVANNDKAVFLSDLVKRKLRLAQFFSDILPGSLLRRREWSISSDLQVAVTACLYRTLPVNSAVALLSKLKLTRDESEQFLAMLFFPCWRHMLRIDQAGGLSFYLERDWEQQLLMTVSGWFGVSSGPAELLKELNKKFDCVPAGIGIHWRPNAEIRLRLYAVLSARAIASGRKARSIFSFISEQFRCVIPAWVDELIGRPRRALVLNVEERSGLLVIKLEIPDVGWPELSAVAELSGNDAIALFRSKPPRKLSYVGIRLGSKAEPEKVTFYLPYGYTPTLRGGRGVVYQCN